MSSVRDLGSGNYAVQVVNPDGSTLSGSGGAALTATAVGAVTADQNAVVAAATGLRFCGFSVRENAGSPAAAEFIIKHSEASHCEVRCSIEDRSLVLTVRDDGKGIAADLQ